MRLLPTRSGPKQPRSTVASGTGHLQTSQPKQIATWSRSSSHSKLVQNNRSSSIAYASLDLKILYRLAWSDYFSFTDWKTEVLTQLTVNTVTKSRIMFCSRIRPGACDTRLQVLHFDVWPWSSTGISLDVCQQVLVLILFSFLKYIKPVPACCCCCWNSSPLLLSCLSL